jgi:hypothetical protein
LGRWVAAAGETRRREAGLVREALPQSLEDLVRGYDAQKVKSLTRDFLDAPAAGKERL